MSKKAESVSELLEKTGLDKTFKAAVNREIQERTLSKFLFALRCEHNLTQKEMADKIGCSQSRISKIESAVNSKIQIKDLLDYAHPLGLQLELGYRSKKVKIVDLIKFHALKINMYLERLVALAQKDEALADSIGKFHEELSANMEKFIKDNYSNLGFSKKSSLPLEKREIHISPPIDMQEIDEAKQNGLPVSC
jgi:transcriptional regulator with XRE-family HTH domain